MALLRILLRPVLLAIGLLGGFFLARRFGHLPTTPVSIDRLANDTSRSLEEKIDTLRVSLGVPGAYVGIWCGDVALLDAGFGTVALGKTTPPANDTVFRIGSLTKMAVTTAALRLEAQGKISLADPISRYVPQVPNGDQISLAMLGNHTSGLAEYIAARAPKIAYAATPERKWTAQELLNLSFVQGPKFSPGSSWAYANTNTILLGIALEKVTGLPLEKILQQEIFTPLDLTNTAYTLDPTLPENAARGYNWGDNSSPSWWRGKGVILHDTTHGSPSIWNAAGAMTATGTDVKKLVRAVARGELVDTERHHRRLDWRKTNRPGVSGYGFGLMNFQDWLGHSGQVPGYSALAVHHPATDTTVVVLTNLYADQQNNAPADQIFELIRLHLNAEKNPKN